MRRLIRGTTLICDIVVCADLVAFLGLMNLTLSDCLLGCGWTLSQQFVRTM